MEVTETAARVAEIGEIVRENRVLPVGGRTKPALSRSLEPGVVEIEMSSLRGIREYDPGDLTFTAAAGTPVVEVEEVLAGHGQYLPFDPPLAAAGATLGGMVATGASGSNAHRHGGVRDSVVGVRLIDGTGELVSGGGKVVKNAAGFDLPKLMVGSRGRLGVLVELSFKVLPRPRANLTLAFELGSSAAAPAALAKLVRGPVHLDALDLEPPSRVLVRLGGMPAGLAARARRLEAQVGSAPERLEGEPEARLWRDLSEFRWVPAGARLIRVGLTVADIPALDRVLAGAAAVRRYARGGNVAWIAWPDAAPLEQLDRRLEETGLRGMALSGPSHRALLGRSAGGEFAARIQRGMDPNDHFTER